MRAEFVWEEWKTKGRDAFVCFGLDLEGGTYLGGDPTLSLLKT